jgi:hypothetical protein
MLSNTSTVALNLPARCYDPTIRPRPVGPGMAIAPGRECIIAPVSKVARAISRLAHPVPAWVFPLADIGRRRFTRVPPRPPALDHSAKSLGLAVRDRSVRGVAEISRYGRTHLWIGIELGSGATASDQAK